MRVLKRKLSIKQRFSICIAFIMVFSLFQFPSMIAPTQAVANPSPANYLVNGDFSYGAQGGNTIKNTADGRDPLLGWKVAPISEKSTYQEDWHMELYPPSTYGLPATATDLVSGATLYHTGRVAECNASNVQALYQIVNTTPGELIQWSFWHGGRGGASVIQELHAIVGWTDGITPPDPNYKTTGTKPYDAYAQFTALGNTASDAEIGTKVTKTVSFVERSQWKYVTGIYLVPPGQTKTYFIYQSKGGGSSPAVGNVIADVRFTTLLSALEITQNPNIISGTYTLDNSNPTMYYQFFSSSGTAVGPVYTTTTDFTGYNFTAAYALPNGIPSGNYTMKASFDSGFATYSSTEVTIPNGVQITASNATVVNGFQIPTNAIDNITIAATQGYILPQTVGDLGAGLTYERDAVDLTKATISGTPAGFVSYHIDAIPQYNVVITVENGTVSIASQTVSALSPITPIVVTKDASGELPNIADLSGYGLSYTKDVDGNIATISGLPTRDINLHIPAMPDPLGKYDVTITGSHTSVGYGTQTVRGGYAIGDIHLVAEEHYILPETIGTISGLTYTRDSEDNAKAIITGTPTQDISQLVISTPMPYSVSVQGVNTGSITNASQTVPYGSAVTNIVITAATGYTLPVSMSVGGGLSYVRNTPTQATIMGTVLGAVTTTVTAIPNQYNVYVTATNAVVAGGTQLAVPHGTNLTITLTANTNYTLPATFTVGSGLTYTHNITNPMLATISGTLTGNVNVAMNAMLDSRTVAITGVNATITNGTQTKSHGTAITAINITAASGYHLPMTLALADTGLTYTRLTDTTATITGSITASVALTVTATLNPRTVTITATNATVTSYVQTVEAGSPIATIVVAPYTHYALPDTGDVSIGCGLTYAKQADGTAIITGTPTVDVTHTIVSILDKHHLTITGVNAAVANGNQTKDYGTVITDVIITANDGHFLPANVALDGDLTYELLTPALAKISGVLTANVALTVTATLNPRTVTITATNATVTSYVQTVEAGSPIATIVVAPHTHYALPDTGDVSIGSGLTYAKQADGTANITGIPTVDVAHTIDAMRIYVPVNITLVYATATSVVQSVASGESIQPIHITADSGCVLPASVTLGSELTYVRHTATTATISGTITLPVMQTITASADVTDVITEVDVALTDTATMSDVTTAIEAVQVLTPTQQQTIPTATLEALSDKLLGLTSTLAGSLGVGVDTSLDQLITNGSTLVNNLNAIKGLFVSADDIQSASTIGKDVDVKLNISAVAAPTPATGSPIETIATTGGTTLGVTVNINVTKTVTTTENGTSTALTSSVTSLPVFIPFTIEIPHSIRGHGFYGAIREHNGVAVFLTNPTITNNELSFQTNQFSLYTIVYSDTSFPNGAPAPTPTPTPSPTPTPTPTPTGGGSGGTNSSGTSEDILATILNDTDHIAFVRGYADGKFGANNNLTRAEMAQMFYNLLSNKDSLAAKEGSFSDVNPTKWYSKAVNTLSQLGLIIGNGDAFAPQRAVTRAEFVAVASRFATQQKSDKTFADVPADNWSASFINTAVYYNWITGFSDGTFRPENHITRAEAVTIINRMIKRKADKTFIDLQPTIQTFSDVTTAQWAYYDIVEASVGHTPDFANGTEAWKSLHK